MVPRIGSNQFYSNHWFTSSTLILFFHKVFHFAILSQNSKVFSWVSYLGFLFWLSFHGWKDIFKRFHLLIKVSKPKVKFYNIWYSLGKNST